MRSTQLKTVVHENFGTQKKKQPEAVIVRFGGQD